MTVSRRAHLLKNLLHAFVRWTARILLSSALICWALCQWKSYSFILPTFGETANVFVDGYSWQFRFVEMDTTGFDIETFLWVGNSRTDFWESHPQDGEIDATTLEHAAFRFQWHEREVDTRRLDGRLGSHDYVSYIDSYEIFPPQFFLPHWAVAAILLATNIMLVKAKRHGHQSNAQSTLRDPPNG